MHEFSKYVLGPMILSGLLGGCWGENGQYVGSSLDADGPSL